MIGHIYSIATNSQHNNDQGFGNAIKIIELNLDWSQSFFWDEIGFIRLQITIISLLNFDGTNSTKFRLKLNSAIATSHNKLEYSYRTLELNKCVICVNWFIYLTFMWIVIFNSGLLITDITIQLLLMLCIKLNNQSSLRQIHRPGYSIITK